MALKVFDDGGFGASDIAIMEAIEYAMANGAKITSNSYGCTGCYTDTFNAVLAAVDRAVFMTLGVDWLESRFCRYFSVRAKNLYRSHSE